MEYQGLKRQLDKLQEENMRMKVALRQLRTENQHLLTRSRRNTVSHLKCCFDDLGSGQHCSVSVEQEPSTLQQQPEAFRIQLLGKDSKMAAVCPLEKERKMAAVCQVEKDSKMAAVCQVEKERKMAAVCQLEKEKKMAAVCQLEKERKMAALWPDSPHAGLQKLKGALTEHQAPPFLRTTVQSAGDAASLDTKQNLAPLKKHMGVDRAHPLEPITVKKIHNNGVKEAEQCQPRPLLSSQPMAAPEADTVSSERGRAIKANEYMAWSIDSMGDNIMNFCKDLLLRAKAKEANRKVTEMSEIIYYEGPERLQVLRSTDARTNSESRTPESHATVSNPERTLDSSIKRRSRLPYLKRLHTHMDTSGTPWYPHQNTQDPKLLPDEQNSQPCSRRKTQGVMETGRNGQKRTKLRLKRVKKSTKSHTAHNSVHKTPPTCEPKDDPPCPRRLLPLMRTCIPQTESPGEPSQGPPGPSCRDQEQHRPLSKPQLALDHTFQLLGSDRWEQKIEGLTRIRRLAQWHSDVLVARLHDVCMAVILEAGSPHTLSLNISHFCIHSSVENLRSLVSRAAVATLGELYLHLQRTMDTELDWTTKVLLQKAGESNSFIRQDVGVALGHMLRCCTPSRSMKALLNGGLRHRNVAVRECAAHQLEALVESMGTARLLCCKKDIMNSFLSAVRRMPQDSSQEVRCCGQQIMGILKAHQDFQKKMKKFFP
ncbi:uncharacterized protein LOC135242731 isoform X3 [Anguilla rostrata]|uniref:uncharacterized protein LOC135242731 isoform X3 n=1 Tax=Anguilla rostrata TaxID=7938 RepID=UPI0030D1B295